VRKSHYAWVVAGATLPASVNILVYGVTGPAFVIASATICAIPLVVLFIRNKPEDKGSPRWVRPLVGRRPHGLTTRSPGVSGAA
jgi:hypothetical protein